MAFSNLMFGSKISDISVSSPVLLLRHLTIRTKILDLTKITFSNSIYVKMVK